MNIERFCGDLSKVEQGESSLYVSLPEMTLDFENHTWSPTNTSSGSSLDKVLEYVEGFGNREKGRLEAVAVDRKSQEILSRAGEILFTHIFSPPRLHLFAQRYNQAMFTGLDIAPRIVADAFTYADEIGLNNLRDVVCAPVECSGLSDDSFDVLYTYEAIYHNPWVGFAEQMRLLRQGGVVIASALGPDTDYRQHDATMFPYIFGRLYGFPVRQATGGQFRVHDRPNAPDSMVIVHVQKTDEAYSRLVTDLSVLETVLRLSNPNRDTKGDQCYIESNIYHEVGIGYLLGELGKDGIDQEQLVDSLGRLSQIPTMIYGSEREDLFDPYAVAVVLTQ